MKRLLAVAAVAISLATAVVAQDPEIPFDEFYLDNGLRVVVHEDRKAPIVAITIWYHVGSKNEVPGKTGFAHLFEHLMFNGSENHDDDYFRPLQEVGVTNINGTTDFDRTNYFETVPTSALDLALWLESDRMGHLVGAIDQDKLDEQRGVVQNEKRQGDNEPYGKVFETILTNLFPPGHPYSWETIGSMEDLNAASLEDVKKWFETYYGPNNATLVLAGDIDVATARDKVQRYFGDIPPGPPLTHKQRFIPPNVPSSRIVMEDRVPEARIYKVWLAPEWISDDSTYLQLADYVLTSGKTSRLYRRLVYEDQIATDASAFAMINEIAGAYVVYATAAEGQDLATVERALDEELERFLADGPTRAELDRVKTELRSGFIRGVEQVGGFRGKSNILAENAVYGGRPDFYKHSLELTNTATPQQVLQTARKWIRGEPLVIEVHPYATGLAPDSTSVDRSTMPMPQTFPEAPFPALQQATLANGMRLIVAERHAVPVVQLSLQLDAGYAADQFASPGVATMTMEMLDEGTAEMDALQISDSLATLGAELSSGANLDFSVVGLSALKENLDESLAIYSDVILNPAFPPAELERLKRLQLAGIQQEKNSPTDMALRVLPRLLYGDGHAYSLPMTGSGTEEAVSALDRDDLVAYHDTWFKPNNATMIVVGDTTLAEIQPKLEALFARWRRGDVPAKTLPDVAVPQRPSVYLIDRPGSEQSVIIAGHLIGKRDRADDIAVDAMNDILGGAFTSRVNMNLREDKGWSYGADTTVVQTQAQRPFLAIAPVQADQTAASMREIKREIEELVGARRATNDEVATSKRQSTLTLPGRWETARAVARDIAELVRFRLPDDYWNGYAELVNALDADEVNAAATRLLHPESMTWVVVGDRSVIEQDVRALGFGDLAIVDADGKTQASP
ncbi:MAG TPA: pitrilysin family protein [Gammaproteobacteria bacterium]|nr:pitrilysin family protein [Gammaproteobacteria bacterium]